MRHYSIHHQPAAIFSLPAFSCVGSCFRVPCICDSRKCDLPQPVHLHRTGEKHAYDYEKQTHFIALYTAATSYAGAARRGHRRITPLPACPSPLDNLLPASYLILMVARRSAHHRQFNIKQSLFKRRCIMPVYNNLRPAADMAEKDFELVFPKMSDTEKKRTVQHLLPLCEGLRNEISVKQADNNLLVASWNIKEFGHTTQRLYESYFYIAEIMARFDLIAVQEVKSTLKDLYIVMRLLGPDWGFQINDITEGKDGNSERSAYIYNKKRVELPGLSGEIQLWDELTQNSTIKQLKRTPYITGFRAGWKTFAMICLHLHPGEDPDDIKYRREEVTLLLEAIKEKVETKHMWNENLILCGDFNLYTGDTKDNPTIQAIKDAGYKEIESLVGKDTNASQTEAYDRFFLTQNEYFTLGFNAAGQENGGVFNPFNYVFQDGEHTTYKQFMVEQYTGDKDMNDPVNLEKYYKHPWRKNQLSDHFPIWFELIIDSSDKFLTEKLGEL